jgi:hypothetical protein
MTEGWRVKMKGEMGSTVGDTGSEGTRGQATQRLVGHMEEFGLYYKSNGKPQQVQNRGMQ